MMGPGVAQERIDARGPLTLWEDVFYPEIIDPETGAVLPDGVTGELVLTSLGREAMPLFRYRTRDLTRLLPGADSAFRRIERVKGRSDDMLIIRGVNVFPSQIEAVLAAEPRLAPHYVLEVTRPNRLDELAVVVEVRDGGAGEAARATLEAEAAHLIKVHVGVSCTVRVVPPGTIERSEGKAKRVIDRRPKS
jgi:phenylacetate-CoA ligase